MSQAQLALLERTTNDAAGVAYASPNSWVVKTSKRLSYELRRNSSRNLGRLNDAQFEHLPMLQALQWAPVKILAFLLSNSKSWFAIHLQLRELMYERVERWDIYILLSAFQGHTRYSDVASEESFGKKLSLTDLTSLGKVFHCTKELGFHHSADGLLLSATRGGQSRRWRRYTSCTLEAKWHCSPVRAGRVLLSVRLLALLQRWPRALLDSERRGPATWTFRRSTCTSCEGLFMRRMLAPSAGISGSVDPESSSETAAGRGSVDPAPGAASLSEPGRGSMDPAPGKARKGQQAYLQNHRSLNQLTPRTFPSPSTKPKDSSLVEGWRPMRP